MSDDPYKVLGVSKTASQDEIRKAYRKLAKELHPDLHPGDKAAEARFKEVSSAYHLLGDPERRARFDRGEIDASGAERPEHQFYRHYADGDAGGRYHSSSGFGDFEDISDIFADLFRGREQRGPGPGRMQAKGPDVRYHLEVDFLDAVNGAKRRITLPDGKSIDLTIPAGARDGDTLRLKGKGGPGLGGGPGGDALVELAVKTHPAFRREGDDIVIEIPIGIDEAVLGGKVEVPTVTGRVSLTLPKGSSTGDVLRLKGKGVKPAKGKAGDQRVVLQVVMPERIDSELENFMSEWRKDNAYDPRAKPRRTNA